MADIEASASFAFRFTHVAGAGRVFFDAFNRPDSDLSTSRGWVNVDQVTGAAVIVDSALHISTSSDDGNLFLAPDCGETNHFVQFDVKSVDESGASWICCRVTDYENFLGVRIAGSSYQVYKRTNGIFTLLHTARVPAEPGHTAKIAAVNNRWRLHINGVLDGEGDINAVGDDPNHTLPLSSRQGFIANLPVGPSVFVDSAALPGGDGSREAPYASLTEVDLEDGMIINLARGSYWREQLGQDQHPAHGVSVRAYGEGKMPVVDGADIVTTTWTDEGSNVWSTEVPVSVAPDAALSVWADGVRLFWQDSPDDFDGPGQYNFETSVPTATIYIYSETDPNTNGVVYEYSAREACIWASDRWNIHGIRGKRAGGLNGAIVLRKGSYAHFCVMEDGVYHNGHCDRNSWMFDCISWKCDWPNRGTIYTLSQYSRVSDTGPLIGGFTRCVAVMEEEKLAYARANELAIYGIRCAADGQAASRWEEVIWDSCSGINCTRALDTLESDKHRDYNCHTVNCTTVGVGTNAPDSYSENLWVEGGTGPVDIYRMINYTGSGQMVLEGLRLNLVDDASDGTISAFDGDLIIRNSAIRVSNVPGYTFIIRQESSSNQLTLLNSVIIGDWDNQEMSWVRGYPIEMENNVYGGPNGLDLQINGVSYPSWNDYKAAGLPYDQNSVRVEDGHSLLVDPDNGDFRNAPDSPAIALGAGIKVHDVPYTRIPTHEEIEAM